MATLTKSEEMEIAIDRKLGRIDADARDRGHVPASWTHNEDDGDLTASTRCTLCGADAAVRVRPDGSSWAAGKLRLTACTATPE